MRPTISDHATLPSLKVSTGALVEEVVASLPTASAEMRDLIRLRLEATDAALAYQAHELLTEQRRWERARLPAIDDAVPAERIQLVVSKVLGAHLEAPAQQRLSALHRRSQRRVSGSQAGAAVGSRAHTYLTRALGGRREDALAVVQEALDAGATTAQVMVEVITPAQVELGRRWECGQVSVAHEHYVTAVSELALGLLYPRLVPQRPAHGLRAVAVTSGGETHDLAIRMVSDLLMQDGWRSIPLGSDVPLADLVELTVQHDATVLSISVSMPGHLRWFAGAVERIRADTRLHGLRILAGGRAFDLVPGLAEGLGADASASNPVDAVRLCRRWAAENLGPERHPRK